MMPTTTVTKVTDLRTGMVHNPRLAWVKSFRQEARIIHTYSTTYWDRWPPHSLANSIRVTGRADR